MIEDYKLIMERYEEFKKFDNFDLKLENYVNDKNQNKINNSKSCCS